MSEPWTIRRVLDWSTEDFKKRGIDSPRLTAELLVAHALGCARVSLYLDIDRPLGPAELGRIRELVARRRAREPVAYIVGTRGFYGREFVVSPDVLVPRPDTETLVERALALLDEASMRAPGAARAALDLCTGSGAIAVTLAALRPELRVDATDVSKGALGVARANAEKHAVADRVRLLEGDLFAAVPEGARYDLIVCNPPYIPDAVVDTLEKEVAEHEPRIALAGGADGLDFYRRLAAGLGAHLAPGGSVLLEVGAGQAEDVRCILDTSADLETVGVHRDLGGHDRVVEARRRARPEG